MEALIIWILGRARFGGRR